MNILRLSTLSLTLAIAVFALGYVSPSFADKPGSGPCGQVHCDHGEENPSDLAYTVNLIGPIPALPSVRGAFEFEGGAESVTLQFKGIELRGDVDVTIERPLVADANALVVWEEVFNLCGLLGPDTDPSTTLVTDFTILRGDWVVGQGGDREGIFFKFEIPAIFSPLSDDRPLSATLHLFRTCTSPCGTIPTSATGGTPKRIDLTNSQIHLKGKGGVTAQAACHGDMDLLAASGSTLLITAN